MSTPRRTIHTFAVLAFCASAQLTMAQSPTQVSAAQLASLIQSSPDWKQAELGYKSAQDSYNAAAAGLKPSLSVGGSFSEQDLRSPDAFSGRFVATAGATLLPWASEYENTRQAGRLLQQAALERTYNQSSIWLNAVNRYWSLQSAQQSFELATQTQTLREKQLNQTKAKIQNGAAIQQDLLVAEQNLATAKNQNSSASSQLMLAKLRLAQTLGLPASSVEVATENAPLVKLSTTLEQYLSRALTKRPDVIAANVRLENAQASYVYAKSIRWIPDASVSLGIGESKTISPTLGLDGNSLTGTLNLKNGFGTLSAVVPYYNPNPSASSSTKISLSANINLSVLDARTDAQIASYGTALEAAQLNLSNVKAAVELEIQQRYNEMQNAVAAVKIQQMALTSAQESSKNTKARLAVGTAVQSELDSASLSEAQASQALETAKIAAYLAMLSLHQATGINLLGEQL